MSNVLSSFQPPADLYKLLAHPARLAILTVLREGEQCVCHIEAMLKLRQAYISQQLKLFKDAGIVSDRRDGWNIYYRVTRPEIFTVLDTMYSLTGQPPAIPHVHAKRTCPCPKCNPEQVAAACGRGSQQQT
ncbi:MAG: winged helix-turn-helix transcriptional regulator [Anaerolineae bacterium]|nr:winged helix-turn-helix transcriptional regulator [Anaerolineae bacterium]